MNKESLFICTFIMSVMVFSIFTPFAYAIKEPTTEVSAPQAADLSTRRELAGSCSGDVWFDELNWTEYQNLRNQMITMVGGWGSELQANLEKAGELAGVGTNPEVADAKNIVLPGVTGDPVMLWDIMKKKAVDPSTYCHLNNLFTRGRVAYATELQSSLRYCPTNGSYPCDESLTTSEVSDMKGKESVIDKLKFWESAITPEEQKKLETSAPSSIVETSDAQFVINSDANYFFPSTRVDFLNFIRSLSKIDLYISTVNTLAMVTGGIQMASGFKTVLKKIPGATLQRFFIKEAAKGMSEAGVVGKEVKTVKNAAVDLKNFASKTRTADELKNAYQNSRVVQALRNIFDIQKKNVILFKESIPATYDLGDEAVDVLVSRGRVLQRINENVNVLNAPEKKVLIDAAVERGMIAEGKTASDAKAYLTQRMKTIGEYDTTDQARSAIINEGKSLETMGDTGKALSLGGEIKDQITFLNAVDAADDSVTGMKTTYSTREMWQTLGTLTTKTAKAKFALSFFLKNFGGGYLGAFLRATQISQSVYLGALWLRNNVVANPQLAYPGIVEFQLNNEIGNFVDKSQEYHYLDVKKSVGNTQLGKFLSNTWDQLLTAIGADTKDSPEQQKLKNIQDTVFIMDQDALNSALTESTSGTFIVSPDISSGQKYWKFVSIFSSPTKIYNFEHPRGYTPSGLSAMNLHLSNVNIYGISSEPIDEFDTSLDGFIGGIRIFRNVATTMLLLGLIPAGGHMLLIPGGAALSTAAMGITGATAILGGIPIISYVTGEYGKLSDVKAVDPNVLCKNKFTPSDQNFIRAMKGIRVITSTVSAGASLAPGPGMLVGFVSDIIQMGAGYFESDRMNRITKDLQSCVDTEFEALSFKKMMAPEEVKTTASDMLSPLKAEGLKIFDMFAPELTKQFDVFAEDMKQQAMNIQVDAVDSPLTSILGKEVYSVHFRDADIKWFQGPNCNIDICQQEENGFRCITQNGYLIVDNNGNRLVEGPSALGYRVNMPEQYASIVQKVIEVKKKDAEFLDIYPDRVELKGDCIKQSIANLSGLKSTASNIDKKISSLMGNLETIHTSDALIWFDTNKNVDIQFLNEKECSGGEKYGMGEVLRIPDGHLKLYRDTEGKLQAIGSDGQVKCEFKASGNENALVFSNAMIRSGFAQQPSSGNAIDYSDVYHLFIYSLVSPISAQDDIDSYVVKEECTQDDGTKGFKMSIKSSLPDVQEQWNTLLDGICITDAKGEKNSSVNFNDSEVTATDPTGLSKKYTTIGFDPACHDEFSDYTGPAYKLYEEESQKYACLFIEKGPNGQPQIIVDAQSPIPLLSWGGMGGFMMYDSGKGTISIKNEFPFSLDPKFAYYGAGGLGMMTPALEPWGGKDTRGTTTTGGGGNPLAALPWTPDGLELVLFVIALAGGLLFVRVRYRKTKGT